MLDCPVLAGVHYKHTSLHIRPKSGSAGINIDQSAMDQQAVGVPHSLEKQGFEEIWSLYMHQISPEQLIQIRNIHLNIFIC
jgi:hypothetical protein